MANVTRLKRQLLRQAVQENLEIFAGAPRRPRTRGRTPGRRVALLMAAPILALSASSYLLQRAVVANDEMVVITQVVEPPSTVVPAAPAELPAPEAIEPAVLNLGVRRIVLDPGHGGDNEGTVAPGGLREKDLTLDVALRLERLLEDEAYEVLLTRDEDETVGLQDRTLFANQQRADLFVSIHVNWIETRQVRGVETYYLGATDDPYLKKVAAAENQGSGYSLADFRSLLEDLYTGVRQDESRRLAEAVQRELFGTLRRVNPGLVDRGVKTAPFVVLVSSQMPAILVEVASLSNEEEAQLLAKPFYRQMIAAALADGLRTYARSLGTSDPPGAVAAAARTNETETS